MESRCLKYRNNTEILWFVPSILHHCTQKKKYAQVKYFTVCDDCKEYLTFIFVIGENEILISVICDLIYFPLVNCAV